MSKFKPPRPANDHLSAFGGGDDPDQLTDAEIDARIEAAEIARRRALKLGLLRMLETPLPSAARETGPDRR
ncbi:hypothetical protein [Caulobacter sp. BK020]|uniref:hypothetical protein n=1 Tax=Caulobacter sp. BK020 TaxID=2512117 RepID=UPI0010520CD2|nr:hypothetical protein [Caulobacter sp. BK020]TCS18294.1 hypothetical protein EV278_101278 [Caulobacter sp. BK020]